MGMMQKTKKSFSDVIRVYNRRLIECRNAYAKDQSDENLVKRDKLVSRVAHKFRETIADPYTSKSLQDEMEVILTWADCDKLISDFVKFYQFCTLADQFSGLDPDKKRKLLQKNNASANGVNAPSISIEGDDPVEKANILLKEIYPFIVKEYAVYDPSESKNEEFPFIGASLLEVGTTSYVLKMATSQSNTVLKIVKPRYRKNPTIIEQTRKYMDEVPKAGNIPEVYACGDSFIYMDYADNFVTLEDYFLILKDQDDKDKNDNKHIDALCSTIIKTLKQLEIVYITGKEEEERQRAELQINVNGEEESAEIDLDAEELEIIKPPLKFHADLSPKNIMVKYDEDSVYHVSEVCLIDFGYNFLLSERVGSVKSFSDLQDYVCETFKNCDSDFATEEENDPKRAACDLYSLGVIMLKNIWPEVADGQSKVSLINRIWGRYPYFAHLIEAMCHSRHCVRFVEKNDGDILALYQKIREDIAVINRDTAVTNKRESKKKVANALTRISPSLDAFREAYRFYRELKKNLKRNFFEIGDTNYLAILFSFSMYSFILTTGLSMTQALQMYLNGMLTWDNMARPLVPLVVTGTFGLVATIYYQNIFSRISFEPALNLIQQKPREEWNKDEKQAFSVLRGFRLSMALNSFCYLLPISWTIWLEPTHWGFCSAVGVFCVAINNWQMKRVFKFAEDKDLAQHSALTESSTFSNFGSFAEWTSMVVVYASILMFVQIGLIGLSFPTNWEVGPVTLALTMPNSFLGITIPELTFTFVKFTDFKMLIPPFLEDLWFYGLLVAIINTLKMLDGNCLSEGPKVRAALMSLSWIYTQGANQRFRSDK